MDYRCGPHVVLAAPASPASIWVECAVHQSVGAQITQRFNRIVGLEFQGEELLRYGWIIQHAMLD